MVPLKIIHKVVCDYFQIDPEKLFARTRVRHIVYPRQIFFHLAYKYNPELSFEYVGSYASENPFDHATVLYAKNTIEGLVQVDKKVEYDLKLIKELVEAYKLDDKYPFEFRKHKILTKLFKSKNEAEFDELLQGFAMEIENIHENV